MILDYIEDNQSNNFKCSKCKLKFNIKVKKGDTCYNCYILDKGFKQITVNKNLINSNMSLDELKIYHKPISKMSDKEVILINDAVQAHILLKSNISAVDFCREGSRVAC